MFPRVDPQNDFGASSLARWAWWHYQPHHGLRATAHTDVEKRPASPRHTARLRFEFGPQGPWPGERPKTYRRAHHLPPRAGGLLNRSLWQLLTTKLADDGVHRSAEAPRASARGHLTRHVSDAGRPGSQSLLREVAEGDNRCVCRVDAASPMRRMETGGTSSMRISRRRVTLPRSRSRKQYGTSRRRSEPRILVRPLTDDSPVNSDWPPRAILRS